MWVLFGACITFLVVWFVVPAAREFSGSRPSACEAYRRGEVGPVSRSWGNDHHSAYGRDPRNRRS